MAPVSRHPAPRVLVAGALIIVLASAAIGLAIALSGGKKAATATVPAVGSLVNALPEAAGVHRLFHGIPQHGLRLGRASAPVTVTEYVDLQCPYCKELATGVLPDFINRYVRTGKAALVLRPLAFLGPDSVRGRNAVIAAGRQNKAFELADLLFANQGTENSGWLDDELVAKAAASIPGLHPRVLMEERDGAAVDTTVVQLDVLSGDDQVHGTPTLFVGSAGSPQRTKLVAPSEAALVAAVTRLSPAG